MRYLSEWLSSKRSEIANVNEDMEKKYPIGGNVNWCSYCEKHYGDSSKKNLIELLYDPAVPLLGILPKTMKILI